MWAIRLRFASMRIKWSYLIAFQHFRFLEALHRIDLPCVDLLNQTDLDGRSFGILQCAFEDKTHLAECTLADDLDCAEVCQCNLGPFETKVL